MCTVCWQGLSARQLKTLAAWMECLVLGVDVTFMIPIPGHTRALTDIIWHNCVLTKFWLRESTQLHSQSLTMTAILDSNVGGRSANRTPRNRTLVKMAWVSLRKELLPRRLPCKIRVHSCRTFLLVDKKFSIVDTKSIVFAAVLFELGGPLQNR